jgi:GT2 family glycosyltransferase
MAEIGLDSQRNGANRQAEILSWQVGTTMEGGCSGAFIFSWTDEWWRGGHEIEDWDFGLVTRDRMPKPALKEVSNAFKNVPLPTHAELPSISVVVCTLNGAKTIRDTFEGLKKVDYPDFEVILVDDGSTDSSIEIAADYDVRVISTPNRGLSAARNTGMEEANGDIVVYLDDDAWPDRNWLRYIADAFLTHDYAAVGGPNISPPNTGDIADCVNNAPGGPVHVLLDDQHAEHIPGCNMAFRRSRLLELGGFDPQFRAAGDDVDLCWRVLEQGWTIGFAPAAMVWHHRRKSIRGYWKQQRGYGKAEALLERKWPEKYNTVGHVAWSGRLYGRGLTRMLGRVSRVYHGAWGSAAFQSRWDTPQHILRVLPTMPEWYLIVLGLGVISTMSVLWDRLLWFVPVFAAATGLTIGQAIWSATQAKFDTKGSRWKRFKLRAITSSLYIAQPIARLWGRLRHGLHAGRMHIPMNLASPFARTINIWREGWQAPEDKIRALLAKLQSDGAVIISGGNYDRWDFGVRGGLLAGARVLMTVEEHGAGKQMFRFIVWPRYSTEGLVTILVLAALAAGAVFDRSIAAYLIFTALTAILAVRLLQEGAAALGAIEKALSEPFDEEPPTR